MTDLTFTVGERVTLDLRDCRGDITLRDWDGATLKVTAEPESQPYVLREQDMFRIRLSAGGMVSLPIGLPAEVRVPDVVRLRVQRAGGETDVRPVTGAGSRGDSDGDTGSRDGDEPRDFAEFADRMSDYSRRIFQDVARAVRSNGAGASDDMARKLEEAAERIDETARRAAERVQREVERTVAKAERYEEHGRRAAQHAEERARRVAERVARHTQREAERAGRRARGRWWFTEAAEGWARTGGAGETERRRATEEERLTIMQMLRDGKISAEQAAQLLDALGG